MEPREQLAARRKVCGFSQESLAQALGVTTSSVARWEQGTSTPLARHRRPLAKLLNVSLADLEHLISSVPNQSTDTSVALRPSPLKGLNLFGAMEQTASRAYSFETQLIPELLQTRDYALAVAQTDFRQLTHDERVKTIDLRIARQQRLDAHSHALELVSVIDELVLHRFIGGVHVLNDQLRYLTEMAVQPNISIRIMPAQDTALAGSPTGGSAAWARFGSFNLLATGGLNATFLAAVDSGIGIEYYDSPQTVAMYEDLFAHLTEAALSEEASVDLINTKMKQTSPDLG